VVRRISVLRFMDSGGDNGIKEIGSLEFWMFSALSPPSSSEVRTD